MSHHPTSPCQFICTTFREEIVKVADAWFLVEFRNDMSVVSSSDKGQALKVDRYFHGTSFPAPFFTRLFCSLSSMRKSTVIVPAEAQLSHLLLVEANEFVLQLSQKTKKILMVMNRKYDPAALPARNKIAILVAHFLS
jgi:hypothetical protein